MNEIWKKVPGYEDYEISNIGNLMSYKCKKSKLIKGTINEDGYLRYTITNKKGVFTSGAQVIVAMAFLGHIPDGNKLVIDHKNENPLDNSVENLQIVTQRYNIRKNPGKYSSQYKGISWYNTLKKWRAQIRINGKQKHIGCFDNEYDAHLAYQNKLKELNLIN